MNSFVYAWDFLSNCIVPELNDICFGFQVEDNNSFKVFCFDLSYVNRWEEALKH